MFKNIYLAVSSICYLVYFIIMLPSRIKFLNKWKNYHYSNNKKNNCSDDESYKCIRSGKLTEMYIISNIKYISLRILSIFKPEFFPLVLLDNIKNVVKHLLRWNKWGFHYFGIYHIVCLSLDIFFIISSLKKNKDTGIF